MDHTGVSFTYSISAHAVAYKSLFLDSDTTFVGLIRSQ